MKLRRPCPHGFYDAHGFDSQFCPGGVFLPDDTLIIERGSDGKFPEWITDVDGPVWHQCGGTDDLLEEIYQAIQAREST